MSLITFSVARCLGAFLLCMASWPLTVQADVSTPSPPEVAQSPETALEVNRNSKHSSRFSENLFPKTKINRFPILEATSFDNFIREDIPEGIEKKLTIEQIQKLSLQSWIEQGNSIFVNYELPYSGSFKALVFTLEGEMELTTLMVTFDEDFNKIDELRIAYDEVAESWLRVKSKISKNRIEVRTIDESSGKTVIKTKIFKINEDGSFLDISTNQNRLTRR